MLFACLLAQADPAALVERLRSDDIEVRERAEADLVRLGPVAEAALDLASKDADPEVAERARRLLFFAVAPYRRDLLLEVRHVGRHLATALDGPPAGLSPLLSILWKLDPRHPLIKEPTIARLSRIELDLTYDSQERWRRFQEQVAEEFDKGAYDRSCGTCVGRRLRTCRLGIVFENARAEAILDYLKQLGDVRLVMDTMDVQLERAVTVEAKDITLAEAFERVLAPFELAVRVGEGGVILVVAQ